MSAYLQTPVLTKHARERCAEMGISTKIAKAIHRTRTMTYPGTVTRNGEPSYIAWSDRHPEYVVAYLPNDEDADLILTVLFNTPEFHERAGTTFVTRTPAEANV